METTGRCAMCQLFSKAFALVKAAAVEAQSGAEDDADDDDEEDSDAEDVDDDTVADVTGSGRFDEEEDMFVGLDDPQLVRTLQVGCTAGV